MSFTRVFLVALLCAGFALGGCAAKEPEPITPAGRISEAPAFPVGTLFA